MGKVHRVVLLLLMAVLLSADVATVKDFKVNRSSVVIAFSKPIAMSDVRSFVLQLRDGNNFRRVIDIESRFLLSPQIDTKTAIPTVKIAQFSKDLTRVVLSHKSEFEIELKIDGADLIINIIAQEEQANDIAIRSDHKRLIVIDAGHGGKDTGAIAARGTTEKEIVLEVSKMTTEYLKKRGFDVIMTREKDHFVELQERTAIANGKKADLFISIHANASPIGSNFEGIETYFLSPARSERAKDVAALENNAVMENMGKFSQETFLNFLNREVVVQSNKLAIDVQRGMLFVVRQKFPSALDNGVREGPFWVLVGAQMPAVLVEIGYLSHKEEVKRLVSREYQAAIAEGIALGVESYFINQTR